MNRAAVVARRDLLRLAEEGAGAFFVHVDVDVRIGLRLKDDVDARRIDDDRGVRARRELIGTRAARSVAAGRVLAVRGDRRWAG